MRCPECGEPASRWHPRDWTWFDWVIVAVLVANVVDGFV